MASSAGADASIGGGGGDGPDLKRRRLLDAGGPVEDDETARQKMADAGFNPDDVTEFKSIDRDAFRPMGYFAWKGDLPMMRWLYVNGAGTRDEELTSESPMWAAATSGHLEVCKWLVDHGAAEDITRTMPESESADGVAPNAALTSVFSFLDLHHVTKWLILKGALCNDTGDLDVDRMKTDLNYGDLNRYNEASDVERRELLQWARQHYQPCPRAALKIFLMGTLPTPAYTSATVLRRVLSAKISPAAADRILANTPPDHYRLLWDEMFSHRVHSLAAFCGKSGILELIGDFVSFRGREARIVRQLVEILPRVFHSLEDEDSYRF